MKRISLILSALLLVSSVHSQVSLSVQAPPAASSTGFRIMNGTTAHTTFRGHLILPASELVGIPTGTTLASLAFNIVAAPATAAGGTVIFYLQNTTDATNLKSTTWATAITGMTSVYSGAFNIPAAVAPINTVLTTPFVYTGGGLYVAYDYIGTTFSTVGATFASSAGTSIPAGVRCEPGATTTAPATLTQPSAFRPSVTFSFANPFTDNLAVLGITPDKGKDNLLFGTTQSIQSTIRNSSSGVLTNKLVTLNITGANPYTTTQTIASIAPGADASVVFTGVPKTSTGAQTITVSVPADQQTNNDSFLAKQNIYCDTVGFSAGDSITGGVGFNNAAGILANLLVLPNTQEMFVKKVRPRIAIGPGLAGNTIKGVLLNAAGVIIDSTASYTLLASDAGKTVELTYLNGNIDLSGDSVYYGFRQDSNVVTGYFPLATQSAFNVPLNVYCGFNAQGGGFFTSNTLGIFMIEAVLATTPFTLTSNAASGTICAATPLNLTVAPGFTNYNFNIDGSVAQTGLTNTYSYTPTALTTAIVTGTLGNCPFTDTLTVGVVTSINTPIAAGFCPGGNYVFGGQTLTTAGVYFDTLTSVGGCDSVVTLTLSAFLPSASAITAGLCPGGSYQFGNQSITSLGQHVRTIPNAQGCDSTITLTLFPLVATSSTSTSSICQGSSLMFGSQTITSPGTYSRTIPNAVGCDSTITLTVVFQTFNTTVTQTGTTLSVPMQTGATYRWINCPQLNPIGGAVNSTYTPTTLTGSYAVVVTINGCRDTSACFNFDQSGLKDVNLSSFVDVYPNPTTDILKVESNSFGIINYKVLDLNGRVIVSDAIQGSASLVQLSTVNFENGTYILDLTTERGSIKKVFVKQ